VHGSATTLTTAWLASDKAASGCTLPTIIQNGTHSIVLVVYKHGETNGRATRQIEGRDINISNLGWEELEKDVKVAVVIRDKVVHVDIRIRVVFGVGVIVITGG
jgi:hypothetical protein